MEKEIKEKLDEVMAKLKEANDKNEVEKISQYVELLNKLWSETNKDRLLNAEKDGFYPPD
tara:strand:+ start:18 stop:197 length:180 start_codon:yes stop_codon:yes gene_type:complete